MFKQFQKLFLCDIDGCTKEYTNSSHLKRHKKTFHVAKPEMPSVACKQPNCYQMFTSRDNMNRHYQTHHVNLLPQACPQCDERFRRKNQLKKHVISKHSGEYPYRCKDCNKGFVTTFSYSRHLTTHKAITKEKSCPDCHLTFEKWSLLVEHRRRMHNNEARFTCDICSKTFCRKPNIKDHMKLHLSTEIVFQCHYKNCPKFYNAKRNLESHIRSKHEGKRWFCNMCNEQKSTKQKLEQHIRAHLDPVLSKRLNKKQTHVTSTKARIVGVALPQHVQEKLLNDEASQVVIDSFLTLESTHETETSAAEISDF